jgi:hypothetical protein
MTFGTKVRHPERQQSILLKTEIKITSLWNDNKAGKDPGADISFMVLITLPSLVLFVKRSQPLDIHNHRCIQE